MGVAQESSSDRMLTGTEEHGRSSPNQHSASAIEASGSGLSSLSRLKPLSTTGQLPNWQAGLATGMREKRRFAKIARMVN